MKKMWLKRLLLFALVALVLVQLVPVSRTNPRVDEEVPMPPDVRLILKRACYDCHSNEVVWPWYSRAAPVSWLVARDVRVGREAVNYSTWNRYDAEERGELIWETWEEVSEGEMAPWFYRAVHPQARLTDDDRAALRRWAIAASGGSRHEEADDH